MRSDFGTTSKGEKAALYTLKNGNGMEAAVSDYGAVLVKVLVPDREGKLRDVVLGYDDVSGYEAGTLYFGETVEACTGPTNGVDWPVPILVLD